MKTLTTVFAALLLSTTLTFANTEKEKEVDATYQVGMYFDGSSNTIKTFYEKEEGQKLKVQLKTIDGKVLHTSYVGKKLSAATIHFNVEDLPDGAYTLEMTDGDVVTTKNISLDTSQPERTLKF